MKQTIRNACGTMALLHALANVESPPKDNSFLSTLAKETKDCSPEERALFLEKDEKLAMVHAHFATQGQSAMDHNTRYHFVAFVNKDGHIWELDGRRQTPLHKAKVTENGFAI